MLYANIDLHLKRLGTSFEDMMAFGGSWTNEVTRWFNLFQPPPTPTHPQEGNYQLGKHPKACEVLEDALEATLVVC